MSVRARTRGAWWGLLGASVLVSGATVVAVVVAVWSVQAGDGHGPTQPGWAPWVGMIVAAVTGGAAALVARLRRWGVLVPPVVAVGLASVAAGAATVDWRVGVAAAVVVGTVGAVFGVLLAELLQAQARGQDDSRAPLSQVLAGLGCFVAVVSTLVLPVMAVVDTAADWTVAGLLVALVVAIAIAGVAVWRPTMAVWVWLVVLAVGAGVVWLALPDVGAFAALVVPVVALAVLGFTYPRVAGWAIGALGFVLWPPLMVAGGLYLASYGAPRSGQWGRSPLVDARGQ